MSTNVLFPPPRNVDNMECKRYRILFGRLSISNSEARGSIASFMIESASEFAISYSFSSYKISYEVIYEYAVNSPFRDREPRLPVWVAAKQCSTSP